MQRKNPERVTQSYRPAMVSISAHVRGPRVTGCRDLTLDGFTLETEEHVEPGTNGRFRVLASLATIEMTVEARAVHCHALSGPIGRFVSTWEISDGPGLESLLVAVANGWTTRCEPSAIVDA
jgi:hypothetical protein